MNILEIIIILVVIGLAAWGYYRGFVRKLASTLSLIISITLVSVLLPGITGFLKNSTPVYSYIVKQCEHAVEERLDSADFQNHSFTRVEQTELIDQLPLPERMKDLLQDYNNNEGYQNLAVSRFQDYIVNFIATQVLNILTYVIAVLMVQVILWILFLALDVLANLPILGTVNHLAGMALGLVQALFLIWLFFLILTMINSTGVGLALMSMVQSSVILSKLYHANLFMKIVMWAAMHFVG